MGIRNELLKPARFTFQTAKFLGTLGLHAADGVMTNLSGWPLGERLQREHVQNEEKSIVKEMRERRDEPEILTIDALRLVRLKQHAMTESGSADYREIIRVSMLSAGCSIEEVDKTLESSRLQQIIDAPAQDPFMQLTSIPEQTASQVPTNTV